MIRYIYTVAFYIFLPFILIRLWIKSSQLKRKGALRFWYERLGLFLRPCPKKGIWVHAVSVGEALLAIPLIEGLQLRYPTIPIVVTNETFMGAERIQVALGNTVNQLYFPYDLPLILKKFLKKLQPRLLILIEMELWPNLLALCRSRKIPVMLANARLSERSARGYRRVLPIIRSMLKNINLVAAQFPSDADRFINLGLPTDRIHIAGNIKFDLQPPAQLLRQAGLLRHILGGGRLVWIAASTHPGEERVIVEAFKQVRANLTNVLLVSVPRHIERATCLEHFYKKQGLNVIKRSENRLCVSTTDIFIGDTMGELLSFYAASDLAFVGGSLIKKGGGGHNPIEPAAVGVPILTGPYTFNFESITGQLRQQGIGFQISDSQSLAEQVIYLLSNPLKRKKIGIKAKRFVRENTGASVKQLQLIESLI